MSSLVLLEPEIPSPLDVTGKNNVNFFLAAMLAVVAFPLFMDKVEVMVRVRVFLLLSMLQNQNITKVYVKHYQNLFQDIPDYPINKQQHKKEKPTAITVLQKKGGGVRRGMITITDSMFFFCRLL